MDYQMFSLDFEEFLWARGYGDSLVEELLGSMIKMQPLSGITMKVCGGLFLDYCILGGMPAVVRDYIVRGNFEGSLQTQRQLLADYRQDVRKYASGMDQTRIINVFQQIPVQLAKDNKKFQISRVAPGARFKDYRGCLEWMQDPGIIYVCYCLCQAELPLRGNYDGSKYKLYFADSGLLVAMLDEEAQEDLRRTGTWAYIRGRFMKILSEKCW